MTIPIGTYLQQEWVSLTGTATPDLSSDAGRRLLLDNKTADGVPIRDGLTVYRRRFVDDDWENSACREAEPTALTLDATKHEIDLNPLSSQRALYEQGTNRWLGVLTVWYGRRESITSILRQELIEQRNEIDRKLAALDAPVESSVTKAV